LFLKKGSLMKNKYVVLMAGGILTASFVVAAFIYNHNVSNELAEKALDNASSLVRDYSPTIGNTEAKVTIVEFFDPACETCKAFHPFVKNLMDSNPGKIKLVMRYLPLHQGSDYVVKILESAKMQGKFWETLDATYAAQPVWAAHGDPQPERLWMRIGRAGLNIAQAKEDMANSIIIERVQQDLEDAKNLQVNKTPGFFVNGKPLVKFGYKQLQELVESEIRRNY
jgi:protein-disulfide isomerase